MSSSYTLGWYCKYPVMCIKPHMKIVLNKCTFLSFLSFAQNYSVQMFYKNDHVLEKNTKIKQYFISATLSMSLVETLGLTAEWQTGKSEREHANANAVILLKWVSCTKNHHFLSWTGKLSIATKTFFVPGCKHVYFCFWHGDGLHFGVSHLRNCSFCHFDLIF